MSFSQRKEELIKSIVDNDGMLGAYLDYWVGLSPGEFSAGDVARDFPLDKNSDQSPWMQRLSVMMHLEAMVEDGTLQRVGNRRGAYRPTQLECAPMDFTTTTIKPVNIVWPFGIQQLVNLYPGNIATLGGQKNAGKTAFLMNLARYNRNDWDVHYFNSEAGPEEMLSRLNMFQDMSLTEWDKVKFYERSQNFAEVVKAGPGKLNIIDFLECHDEFYAIGGLIRDIFDALHGALCVIAIQQNPGTEDPIGGKRSTEKSRLHLKMTPGNLAIKVGKNWAQPGVNPNGLFLEYKLRGGWDFQAMPDPADRSKVWQRED